MTHDFHNDSRNYAIYHEIRHDSGNNRLHGTGKSRGVFYIFCFVGLLLMAASPLLGALVIILGAKITHV